MYRRVWLGGSENKNSSEFIQKGYEKPMLEEVKCARGEMLCAPEATDSGCNAGGKLVNCEYYVSSQVISSLASRP